MAASPFTASAALSQLVVVEHGERVSVAACGSLLAQLGAEVVLIEPPEARGGNKWRNRAVIAAGKRSVTVDPHSAADAELLERTLTRADIVLLSSDVSPVPRRRWRDDQIVCDISAFGDSGPMAGAAYSDALVQAVSGIADTTGDPAGAPVPVGFPILEFCAAIYAAAAVTAALRARRLQGRGQRVDIALYDCAVSTLSTFLPFHMIGRPVTRAGNRHSLAAPWNAYRAADGWTLICTATDEQWQRLCTAMSRPELARLEKFITNAARVQHRAEVDAIVEQWVSAQTVLACIERLSATGVACGPVVTVEQLEHEENLLHRRMIHRIRDPLTGRDVALPGSPLKASRTPGRAPDHIPRPDADRSRVAALKAAPQPAARREAAPPPKRILSGVRVVEIGQFTTAPLVARQLGALGAEVFKVEPPGGDGSRGWPPNQGDQGYFFTFSNSDKKSLVLDLGNRRDKATFRAFLKSADILVENLKAGSLARLGFGRTELTALNPRLIYCSICGFGADSVYPARPAFDTVVQAMSGFMDLTRSEGIPTKAGISAADIAGGTFGLLGVLAALEYRDRTGQGQHLDISMQDVAAWATQTAWNGVAPAPAATTVRCADGFALIEGTPADLERLLAKRDAQELTRSALVGLAGESGIAAAPVLSVSEVAGSEQLAARQLIVQSIGTDGRKWPLLNSPLRLALTPPLVARPIGKLGEANEELLATLAHLAPIE